MKTIYYKTNGKVAEVHYKTMNLLNLKMMLLSLSSSEEKEYILRYVSKNYPDVYREYTQNVKHVRENTLSADFHL